MSTTSERILTPEKEKAVQAVRAALQDLVAALGHVAAETEDEGTLRSSLRQLDDFFLLVIVGEFNAGKSALINALLGESVLTEGVTPTTKEIQILRHSEQTEASTADGIRVVSAAAPLLRDIHLVDTPGTNAIAREHEALTRQFIPRADLILFVTSADRPFTESEHLFMEQIREWGKKVVIVINKADILATPQDLDRVCNFVRESVRELLAFEPELFPVSARAALQAKNNGETEALRQSRFDALEGYIRTKLDDEERFRLKLLNPVGIGLRLIEKHSALVTERLGILKADVATVEQIRSLSNGFRKEMTRGFELRLSEVDNLLHRFENQGDEFFEETVRLGRITDLLNKSKIRADFERQVVGDVPAKIEECVEHVIDWLVASDLQQWQEVRDLLKERKTDHSERIAGRLAGGFEYERGRLLESVGKAAQGTLEGYNQRAEAARMADSVQTAVANAALLEVGAVGLGTGVALVATSTAADVTGILAAGVLATVGFFVIPRRRRQAKRELHERIAKLREQLMTALTSQFQKEVKRSVNRIEEAIAPYVRFVEGERDNLRKRQEELSAVKSRLLIVKSEIGAA